MKKSRLLVIIVAAAGLAAMVAMFECGRRAYEPPHLARKSELSEAELKFGVAPRRSSSVTYQPDVILIKGGADRVRSVSDDGLTWTIDAGAGGASDLKVGKIMFATGRAVGRVLALRQTGQGLAVTLGPVELTDLVSELSFKMEQPLDMSQVIQYEMPKLPYRPDDVTRNFENNGFALKPASYSVSDSPLALQRAKSDVGFFKTWGFAGDSGVGVSGTRDANGVRIDTGFVLALEKPSIYVNVEIHQARITKAEIKVHGGAKWLAHFDAAGVNGVKGNIHEIVPLPVDFSFPITGPASAFPFAVTVRHVFSVKTQFTSQGALRAKGELKIAGDFYAGYDGSKFSTSGPSFTLENNFVRDMRGVSIGPEQMVLAHEVRVIVGVGAWGFVTGPYVGLNTALVVRQGSTVGIVVCKGGAIESNLTAGVGYSMPQPVTSAINFILRALNAKAIQGHGGLEAARFRLFHIDDEPKAAICGGG